MKNVLYFSLVVSLFFACGQSGTNKETKREPPRNGAFYIPEDDTVNFVKQIYKDGILRSVDTFVNNRITGISVSYFETGKLRSTIAYKDAKRNGLSIAYYDTGEKYEEIPYVNGKKEGVKTRYYKNGKVSMTCPYKDGEPVPSLEEFGSNGDKIPQPTIKFKTYKNGVKAEFSDPSFKAQKFYRLQGNKMTEYVAKGGLIMPAKGARLRIVYMSPRGNEGAIEQVYN